MLSVAENNGQGIRAAFKLRERLYFVKEHSLLRNAGRWHQRAVALVHFPKCSAASGTPSVRGVGVGEDWVVIAHRTGAIPFHRR